MICRHCNQAGWVLSEHPDKLVDLCPTCNGRGEIVEPLAPRRLSLRERVSYGIVRWLCALKASA